MEKRSFSGAASIGPLPKAARQYDARVLAVDADPAVEPCLRLQVRINRVDIEFLPQRSEQLGASLLNGVELVTGTDICFRDEMVEPLYRLLRRAGKAGTQRVIIYARSRERSARRSKSMLSP